MPRLVRMTLALAPLVVVPLLFVAVLRSGDPAPGWRRSLPREGYRADRCTLLVLVQGARLRRLRRGAGPGRRR